MEVHAVDLFGGPGGWDVAARELGFDPLGIELDDAACATRAAAGLRTLQADVSALDPREFEPVRGLVASAPCPAFSAGGKGAGRRALPAYASEIAHMMDGHSIRRDLLDQECDDASAHLVLEPLRWALALRPRWVACEQVPPVLPLWEAMGRALQRLGYSAWWGLLSAERYGVPQTRVRAILLASCDREVHAPSATHQRYVPPRRVSESSLSLFDSDPERIVHPADADLLPWVSMADALGWGMTERPSVTVLAKVGGRGGNRPLEGGSGARALLAAERDRGAWSAKDLVGFPRRADAGAAITVGDAEYRERDFRLASQPAQTLTEKSRSWVRVRPATTVQCDPATVRVTVEEAAALQAFPVGYPWQGTRTKQFEQVGNAVPPLLALAVLRAVV